MRTRLLFDSLREKIIGKNLKIVLPEGNDERVLQAAARLEFEGLIEPVILGGAKEVRALLVKSGFAGQSYVITNPAEHDQFGEMREAFLEIRKGKVTPEDTGRLLQDVNHFGAMLVKPGLADRMVSGAIHSTTNMVRPVLQIIKTKPGILRTSGVFLMNREIAEQHLVFADCAINVDPTAQELAEIAVNTADTVKVPDIEPKIAMPSFSTKGSVKASQVEKVQTATKVAKETRPDILSDGELQFDAVFVPGAAAVKTPDSDIAGQINVLIFLDLQSENIGHEIAQRLKMFEVIGPILQGLNRPVNDLPCGSSAEDIYKLAIITTTQVIDGSDN